ncbi:FkbM family methyltransferase [Aquihabitans sp. G128]|uniref:FkbM family methyltransferase n=1 Tax=Aquihabitans sp. G128 TaxID=2849779 RepID=UPI001C21BA29|nr:FkbM family methyltransferase [Aquihabitans sp. G128]QXC61563.1 FkbM family methyltransferase [Aquihabitans sp. G128]
MRLGTQARRLLRRDLLHRVAIRWRIDVVRRFTKDAIADQQVLFAGWPVRTVFDVGANVGLLTDAYLRAFPAARVVAFEAAPPALAALGRRFGGEDRVEVVDRAVTATDGEEVAFHVTPTLGTSSLLEPLGEQSTVVHAQTVSLDGWCAANGVATVDVLKVDVEGAELAVLDGAASLLESGAVGLVFIEARLVAETAGGALLHHVAARLEGDGYLLHNLYGLVESEARGTIYGNAVFLGPRLRQHVADQAEDLGHRVFTRRLGHR